MSSISNYVNTVIYDHLKKDNYYQETIKEYQWLNESDLKQGKVCILPNSLKLETIKAIIKDLNEIFIYPMSSKVKVKSLPSFLTAEDEDWQRCANVICQMIAASTFWTLDENFPETSLVNTLVQFNGESLDLDELTKLTNSKDDYSYYVLSKRCNIKCVYGGKFNFSEIKAKIQENDSYKVQFESIKSDVKIFNQIMQMIEIEKFATRGICNPDGQNTFISRSQNKTLREVVAVNMHELTHAYLRQARVEYIPIEEGICDFVKWHSLVQVFNFDAKSADGYISKAKEYQAAFSKIKELFEGNTIPTTLKEYAGHVPMLKMAIAARK